MAWGPKVQSTRYVCLLPYPRGKPSGRKRRDGREDSTLTLQQTGLVAGSLHELNLEDLRIWVRGTGAIPDPAVTFVMEGTPSALYRSPLNSRFRLCYAAGFA